MSCRSLISWRHSIGWRITTSERNQRWAPCWNTANGASSGRCCPSALLVKWRLADICGGVHNLPQKAPHAFAEALINVATDLATFVLTLGIGTARLRA